MNATTSEEIAFKAVRWGKGKKIVEVGRPLFEEAAASNRILIAAWRLEESWHILIDNYAELEKVFLDTAFQDMIRGHTDFRFFHERRRTYARKLSNFLSSARLYRDGAIDILANFERKPAARTWIVSQYSEQKRDAVEFEFAEFLRNYAQHKDLPVHGTSFGSSWDKKRDELTFSAQAFVSKKRLLADLPRNSSEGLRDFISNAKDRIEISPVVRIYLERFSKVHLTSRNRIKADLDQAILFVRSAESKIDSIIGDGQTGNMYEFFAHDKTGRSVDTVPILEHAADDVERLIKTNRELKNLSKRRVRLRQP